VKVSNTQDTRLPYAVILGLDTVGGLQSARIMAGHGVPVVGIAKNIAHFACRTKACERIIGADTTSKDCVKALLALGPELMQKAVLFPCTDQTVLLISQHRKRLREWYHIQMPDPDVVEMLVDKIRFHFYACANELPTPKSFVIKSREDAESAAKELTFPCVLKPNLKTAAWEDNTNEKAYKVLNAAELLTIFGSCFTWCEGLIVQEWIEGADADIYTCNCYFSANSEPVVTFVSRKLRQWPPRTGSASLCEECRNDIVLQEAIRLFRDLRFHGQGEFEMKRDSRTGRYFVTEANVGRTTSISAMAEAGGVELLYAAYCDATGIPLPVGLEQRYRGVKWIYLRQDIRSALFYWQRGELTLKEWWQSLRGRKTEAVFSWKETGPFWRDLCESLFRGWRKWKQKHLMLALRCPPWLLLGSNDRDVP
jgi:D-aspartate ligase